MEPLSALTEENVEKFIAVGQALLKIRDEQLYRETHNDFYEYCLIRWGLLPDDVEGYLALVEGLSADA